MEAQHGNPLSLHFLTPSSDHFAHLDSFFSFQEHLHLHPYLTKFFIFYVFCVCVCLQVCIWHMGVQNWATDPEAGVIGLWEPTVIIWKPPVRSMSSKLSSLLENKIPLEKFWFQTYLVKQKWSILRWTTNQWQYTDGYSHILKCKLKRLWFGPGIWLFGTEHSRGKLDR